MHSGSTPVDFVYGITISPDSNMSSSPDPHLPLDRAGMEKVARLFGVLAEPTRLQILQRLQEERLSVSELVEHLAVKQANVSKQLGVLFDAGLLDREREGNCVYYSVRDPMVFELCGLVCSKLRRDAAADIASMGGSA